MTNFNHLKEKDVRQDTTSRFELYMIDGSPTLILAPATEANKSYFNKILALSRKMSGIVAAGGLNTAMLDETRSLDKSLYPGLIIQGWENVRDDKGIAVEFSPEECSQFLAQLPNWIFDDIRAYASKPINFINQIDVGTAEKN